MKRFYISILLIKVFAVSNAQENAKFSHFSSWNSFTPKVTLGEHFSVSSEFHFRRTNFVTDWEQLLIRPTLEYKKNATVAYAIGYSYIRNYAFASFATPIDANEHNLWQQVTLSHSEGTYDFHHRFRIEERFIDHVISDNEQGFEIVGNTYANRFRYRFTVNRPLFKLNKTNAVKLQIFDEVWVNLSDILEPKSLNQNWLYTGLYIPIDKHTSLGVGYHHIGLNAGNDTFIANEILATSLFLVL